MRIEQYVFTNSLALIPFRITYVHTLRWAGEKSLTKNSWDVLACHAKSAFECFFKQVFIVRFFFSMCGFTFGDHLFKIQDEENISIAFSNEWHAQTKKSKHCLSIWNNIMHIELHRIWILMKFGGIRLLKSVTSKLRSEGIFVLVKLHWNWLWATKFKSHLTEMIFKAWKPEALRQQRKQISMLTMNHSGLVLLICGFVSMLVTSFTNSAPLKKLRRTCLFAFIFLGSVAFLACSISLKELIRILHAPCGRHCDSSASLHQIRSLATTKHFCQRCEKGYQNRSKDTDKQFRFGAFAKTMYRNPPKIWSQCLQTNNFARKSTGSNEPAQDDFAYQETGSYEPLLRERLEMLNNLPKIYIMTNDCSIDWLIERMNERKNE